MLERRRKEKDGIVRGVIYLKEDKKAKVNCGLGIMHYPVASSLYLFGGTRLAREEANLTSRTCHVLAPQVRVENGPYPPGSG